MNETGSRKLTEANRTGWMILAAFAGSLVALYFKVDSEAVRSLFFVTITGLGVKVSAFTWGNVLEHQAQSKSKLT